MLFANKIAKLLVLLKAVVYAVDSNCKECIARLNALRNNNSSEAVICTLHNNTLALSLARNKRLAHSEVYLGSARGVHNKNTLLKRRKLLGSKAFARGQDNICTREKV